MGIQNIACQLAPATLLREHHDYEATSTHIFEVTHQMLVLLGRSCRAKQGSLELCEEPVFVASLIEATHVLFAVENVDVLAREASLKQRVDCGASAAAIGNGAHDPIGRIRDEFPLFSRTACHGYLEWHTWGSVPAARDVSPDPLQPRQPARAITVRNGGRCCHFLDMPGTALDPRWQPRDAWLLRYGSRDT
jgi:hypothetical protein